MLIDINSETIGWYVIFYDFAYLLLSNLSIKKKLFSDPTEDDMKRYFQVGSVAAYPHCVMMKLHYSISHALDKCLAILEKEDGSMIKHRRRSKKIDNYHHLKESIIDIHDDEYETGGFDGVHFR